MTDSKSSDSKTTASKTRLTTSPEGAAASDGDSEVDRLRAENAELRAQLRRARDDAADPPTGPAAPERPSFGLSAGEAADLAMHGVTTSPFTGERLTASGEGVEMTNDEARERDRRTSKAPAADRAE